MVSAKQELRELFEYSFGLDDIWMHVVYLIVAVGILATIQVGRPIIGTMFTTFLIGVFFGRTTAI